MTRVYQGAIHQPAPGDLVLYKGGPAKVLKVGRIKETGLPGARIITPRGPGAVFMQELHPVPYSAQGRRYGFCALL